MIDGSITSRRFICKRCKCSRHVEYCIRIDSVLMCDFCYAEWIKSPECDIWRAASRAEYSRDVCYKIVEMWASQEDRHAEGN
jgi:hypothetical protein